MIQPKLCSWTKPGAGAEQRRGGARDRPAATGLRTQDGFCVDVIFLLHLAERQNTGLAASKMSVANCLFESGNLGRTRPLRNGEALSAPASLGLGYK